MATTTRTYENIYKEISVALRTTGTATTTNDWQVYAEQDQRLSVLWAEVAEMSLRDGLPATSYLSARLLADRYANDARDCRAQLDAAQRDGTGG